MDVLDAVERQHPFSRGLFELGLDRTSGRRQLDRERDVSSVDPDVLHESEIDDALAEVGVHDGAQGLEYCGFGAGCGPRIPLGRILLPSLTSRPEAHTPKLSPQPQVVAALGFSIWNPLSLRRSG